MPVLSAVAAALTPARQKMLSLILIALWVCSLILQITGSWGADLAPLYLAGHFHAIDQDPLIYALSPGVLGQTPEAWATAMEAMGAADKTAYPYVYPPMWAILVAPLSEALSFQQFFDLFGLIHAAALGGCLLLAHRILTPHITLPPLMLTCVLISAAVFTYPVIAAVFFNQPTALTAALTLLALERLLANRPVHAGIALALAAALKLTPAAFVLIFLFDRNWRAFAAFTIAMVALAALNLIIAPDLTKTFLQTLPNLSAHSSLTRINTSLLPALVTLGGWLGLLPSIPVSTNAVLLGPNGVPFPPALALIPKAAALVAVVAGYFALRGADRGVRLIGATLLVSMILPLFGPLGWQHYYIVPLFLLPILARALSPRAAALAFVGFIFLTSPYCVSWIAMFPRDVAAHQMALTVIWLVILIVATVLLRRSARTA